MYTVVRHRSHKAMRHWQGQVIGCHKSPGPWVTAVKSCLSKHSVALSAGSSRHYCPPSNQSPRHKPGGTA